jgi:hypothetical protein
MKRLVSLPPPLFRLLLKTSFLPSGENIGKAFNISKNVDEILKIENHDFFKALI